MNPPAPLTFEAWWDAYTSGIEQPGKLQAKDAWHAAEQAGYQRGMEQSATLVEALADFTVKRLEPELQGIAWSTHLTWRGAFKRAARMLRRRATPGGR